MTTEAVDLFPPSITVPQRSASIVTARCWMLDYPLGIDVLTVVNHPGSSRRAWITVARTYHPIIKAFTPYRIYLPLPLHLHSIFSAAYHKKPERRAGQEQEMYSRAAF